MKVLFIGKVLDVVFMDNTRLSITNATDELYSKIMQLHDNEEAAKELLLPMMKEEKEIYEEAINFEKRVTQYSDIKRYGDVFIFHKISDVSVPKSVIEAYILAKEEKNEVMVKAILNFWTLACNIKDSRVRNNIFWYCEKYGIKITESGLLKLYRNVVVKEKGTVVTETVRPVEDTPVAENAIPAEFADVDLTLFISSEFIRVRSKAKKNPANFNVIKTKEGKLVSSASQKVIDSAVENFGNLKELYNSLSENSASVKEKGQKLPTKEKMVVPTVYTDAYTGKMHIQIGKMVTMKREDCDPNQSNTCSSGLHCASKDWLQSQGSGYFGSGKVSLLVLVNPVDIVAIPPYDGYGKLRTCAYLPVKALEWKNGSIIDDTYEDVLEGEFFENIVYGEPVKADEESERYSFQIPQAPEINSSQMKTSLQSIKEGIRKKRIL